MRGSSPVDSGVCGADVYEGEEEACQIFCDFFFRGSLLGCATVSPCSVVGVRPDFPSSSRSGFCAFCVLWYRQLIILNCDSRVCRHCLSQLVFFFTRESLLLCRKIVRVCTALFSVIFEFPVKQIVVRYLPRSVLTFILGTPNGAY